MCEEITEEARKLGGRTLEETYVQLWKIYFEMDKLDLAAAMSQRLQREFPNSEFVDAALLQLAGVVRKQGRSRRAIGIYGSLVEMPTSRCAARPSSASPSATRKWPRRPPEPARPSCSTGRSRNTRRSSTGFPTAAGWVRPSAKMANYYYQQKDYARAIDIFESVLKAHPDAKFLDVILFNYGRCLYRLDRKAEARQQFDQLIADFPESPLAADAKRFPRPWRKPRPSELQDRNASRVGSLRVCPQGV